MKKILLFAIVLNLSNFLVAQTEGISYQAVILNPSVQELPGENIHGNILPNKSLSVRFTISNSTNNIEYQEVHSTKTDAYGMINLMIGTGSSSADSFTDIQWDGTEKSLSVEINLDGNFKELSNQPLSFIPYAYHRNIIASGDLSIAGKVSFNNSLEVEGETNLNGNLFVNNQNTSHLSGTLTVDGKTTLNESLSVANNSPSNLSGELTVEGSTNLNKLFVEGETSINNSFKVAGQNSTDLTGILTVDGETNFNNTVNINNESSLNVSGELNINGDLNLNNNLKVIGKTDLYDSLSIYNQKPTFLSGTLLVEQETNLNNSLIVKGETTIKNKLFVENTTFLNDSLTVQGVSNLNNDLDVNGNTNLNSQLNVNNESPTLLTGTLNIQGTTSLENELIVDRVSRLNGGLIVGNKAMSFLGGDLEVSGKQLFRGALTVGDGSPTHLTGMLFVDGRFSLRNDLTVNGLTKLNNSLSVNNGGSTWLTGELVVDGITTLNSTLNVTNGSETNLSGDLNVDKNTIINSNLVVKGTSSLDGISVKNLDVKADNVGFVASYENLNSSDGDGIKIKLGKQKATIISPPSIPGMVSQVEINQLKDLIRCDFTGSKINLLKDIAVDGTIADLEMIGGLAVGISNVLVDFINAEVIAKAIIPELAVPKIDFPELKTPTINISPPSIPGVTIGSKQITPGITLLNFKLLGVDKSVKLPALYTPSLSTPSLAMPSFSIPITQITGGFNLIKRTVLIPETKIIPDIPDINLSSLGINEIDLTDLNFWGIPNICLDDSGATPLNNQNEFIQFADNADNKMGSIRAVSVSDWSKNYLNPAFMFKLKGALTSAVDKNHAKYHFKAEIYKALNDYRSIGVEYSSGNGDYAEWLERENPDELISTGDIVAVKAGKITKNLKNAEQIMAVSHRPIVLGNTPKEGKFHLGNTIAFMGQIPVKVMGPIKAGDYIVAKSEIKGYGVGVNPKEMSIEDFKLTVGRAWDTNTSNGPKMINTVVGIHNGDYINILKRYEQKFKQTEERVQSVEAKLEILTELITKKTPSI